MKHKNIEHQLFLDTFNSLYFKRSTLGILDYAKICKERLIVYIVQVFSDDISGLVHSLCLGHKDNLKESDSASFAKSGTMHILAVSGLHVGMIYIILTINAICLLYAYIITLLEKKISLQVGPEIARRLWWRD